MDESFSRRLARFNQRVTNPIQGQWAWLLPPYALIIHTGRKSGRTFSIPVVAFTQGSTVVIALPYGRNSQWVRNLEAAGGGEIVRAGKRYRLHDPLVSADPPSGVSQAAKLAASQADHVLTATIGERIDNGLLDSYRQRPKSRKAG